MACGRVQRPSGRQHVREVRPTSDDKSFYIKLTGALATFRIASQILGEPYPPSSIWANAVCIVRIGFLADGPSPGSIFPESRKSLQMEVRTRRFGICATLRRYLEECVVTLYSDEGHIHLGRPNDIFPATLNRTIVRGWRCISLCCRPEWREPKARRLLHNPLSNGSQRCNV